MAGKSKQIVVRIPLEVLRLVEDRRQEIAKALPGTKVTLSAAVRAILVEVSRQKK